MPNIFARPEHAPIALDALSPALFAFIAGQIAARAWFDNHPVTLAEWRDQVVASFESSNRFQQDTAARVNDWHKGFERGLAEAVVMGASHATHA